MYAVFRETSYTPGTPVQDSPQFREFQQAHADLPGYVGTVVATVGHGRYLTVTLWDAKEHMDAAREAIGPMVDRLLNPLMTVPAVLLGTGPVVVNDLVSSEASGATT